MKQYVKIWFSSDSFGDTVGLEIDTDELGELPENAPKLVEKFSFVDRGRCVRLHVSETYDTIEEAREAEKPFIPFSDAFFNEDFTLISYAWPGGYPILYLAGNTVLCPKCASKDMYNDDLTFRPDAHDINWENPTLKCDRCNKLIESAYSEDDFKE